MIKKHSASALAGVCVAASMPPWGWWPLAFLGVAMYARVSWRQRDSHPFLSGFVFGIFWFLPSLAWMWFLTAPGYLITVALFASLHGAASLLSSRLARSKNSHRSALVVTHALVETLRLSWPFGGVPLATLAISQSSSPLSALSPFVGPIGLSVLTLFLALLFSRPKVLLALLLMSGVGIFWDGTRDTGETLSITFVQGGGEQGTHAVYSNSRDVFLTHLNALKKITPNEKRDLVVWPENVINKTGDGLFVDSLEYQELSREAKRLNVPLMVGITEDSGPNGFTNAQIVIEPDGVISGRYDKVRRVPFGEYMPMRTLLSSVGANTNLVPRDARAGDARGWLDIAGTRAAVAISWEVFFGGRVNEGITDGATFIVNPTNGSSYTWTILQTQQIASSRLRAREQGRWLVQVSPTGFSAFVSPEGTVMNRSGISEQAIEDFTISLREGQTPYSRMGNAPYIWALLISLGVLVQRRTRAFQISAS